MSTVCRRTTYSSFEWPIHSMRVGKPWQQPYALWIGRPLIARFLVSRVCNFYYFEHTPPIRGSNKSLETTRTKKIQLNSPVSLSANWRRVTVQCQMNSLGRTNLPMHWATQHSFVKSERKNKTTTTYIWMTSRHGSGRDKKHTIQFFANVEWWMNDKLNASHDCAPRSSIKTHKPKKKTVLQIYGNN